VVRFRAGLTEPMSREQLHRSTPHPSRAGRFDEPTVLADARLCCRTEPSATVSILTADGELSFS
jgi:hypothetical protein